MEKGFWFLGVLYAFCFFYFHVVKIAPDQQGWFSSPESIRLTGKLFFAVLIGTIYAMVARNETHYFYQRTLPKTLSSTVNNLLSKIESGWTYKVPNYCLRFFRWRSQEKHLDVENFNTKVEIDEDVFTLKLNDLSKKKMFHDFSAEEQQFIIDFLKEAETELIAHLTAKEEKVKQDKDNEENKFQANLTKRLKTPPSTVSSFSVLDFKKTIKQNKSK